MPFYHHIHCKYTGLKGFITVYNNAIRYKYMITAKAKEKARVLIFWEKHGLEATIRRLSQQKGQHYSYGKRNGLKETKK
jgi:hypothetical protein